MRRLTGETLGKRIATDPAFAPARAILAGQCGAALARIHATPPPPGLDTIDAAETLARYERIWRQKDGRKVRFYPASVSPHTPLEELPVPVLTPDPNSLQGRILQMLDIHENDILNLSQKELSVKLETSQQLVSYHLKALEQWGLIEKEKVALRFRYRLTDRALLLLDSAEFPSLGEEL